MLQRILSILGWIGTALVLVAVAIRFIRPEWNQYAMWAAWGGLGLVILYTLGQWREIVEYFRRRQARYGAIATVGVLVALVIVISGCRQPDGPMPVPEGEDLNRIEDLANNLQNIARGDPDGTRDLAVTRYWSDEIQIWRGTGSFGFALIGTYDKLLNWVVFADWVFFGLTVAGLFVLRPRLGGTPGYRTPGYPLVPAFFVLVAVVVVFSTIRESPREAMYGALVLAAGVPAYYLFKVRSSKFEVQR